MSYKEFKGYQVVSSINFHYVWNIGNYYHADNYRMEMKAINRYKDAVWNVQGFFNNFNLTDSDVLNDVLITGEVTLYGITSNNEKEVLRITTFDL